MNPNLNIVTLQREIFDIVSGLNLSDNVFLSRPLQLKDRVNDFVVCRISTNIYDRKAYGDAIVSIDVYVRDAVEGVTIDSDKFSSINDTLLSNLPTSTQNYNFTFASATPIVYDGNGFSYQIFNLQTLIKQN